MKKEYKKPQLMVENFMVSDFIAACADMLTFADNSQCQGYSVSDDLQQFLDGLKYGLGYFTDAQTGCAEFMTQDEFFDAFGGEVCKHNPTGGYQVFAS